jgi:hypothetical protein
LCNFENGCDFGKGKTDDGECMERPEPGSILGKRGEELEEEEGDEGAEGPGERLRAEEAQEDALECVLP